METTPLPVPQEDSQVSDKSIIQEDEAMKNPLQEQPIRNQRGVVSVVEQPIEDRQAIHKGISQFSLETETEEALSSPDVDARIRSMQIAKKNTPLVIKSASHPNNDVPTSSSENSKKHMTLKDRAQAKSASNPRQGNANNGQPSELYHVPGQAMSGAKNTDDIWLKVIYWGEQEGLPPLPNIPTPKYLRLRDTSATVMVIKKYIVQRNPDIFANEDEVDVIVAGRVMNSECTLHKLRELWLKSVPSTKLFVGRAGDSAEEVTMPIYYARKRLLADSQLPQNSEPVLPSQFEKVPLQGGEDNNPN